MAPTSCSRAIAYPRWVRIEGRLFVVFSIGSLPTGELMDRLFPAATTGQGFELLALRLFRVLRGLSGTRLPLLSYPVPMTRQPVERDRHGLQCRNSDVPADRSRAGSPAGSSGRAFLAKQG